MLDQLGLKEMFRLSLGKSDKITIDNLRFTEFISAFILIVAFK